MINNMERRTDEHRLRWTHEERRNRQDITEVFLVTFVKPFAVCYQTIVLSVCLPVTFVYWGQTVALIIMDA